MVRLTLKRLYLKEQYTIGKLYVDGEYFCDTLEDKVRDVNKNGKFDNGEKKVYGQTAIPYGVYEVILTMSPRFKRILPLLLDVPDFSGVRIHSGNTDADTLGCVLVGKNRAKGKVLDSKKYEQKLVALLMDKCDKAGERCEIEIV